MNNQTYATSARPAFTNDEWIQKYNTRWVAPRTLSRAGKWRFRHLSGVNPSHSIFRLP